MFLLHIGTIASRTIRPLFHASILCEEHAQQLSTRHLEATTDLIIHPQIGFNHLQQSNQQKTLATERNQAVESIQR